MGSWGSQFTTGDQTSGNRETFWKNNYNKCPSCNKSNIKEDKEVAGCRHNGDGYGTCVFTCQDCNWVTSFQYDEADNGSPYFYETRYWGTGPPVQPPKVEPTLSEEHTKKYKLMLKLGAPGDAIGQAMRLDGYWEPTIAKFLKANQS